MSTNNYIQIKEVSLKEYLVSEKDCDTNKEIKMIGTFNTIRTAVKEAQKYTQECEYGVEYGINFSLMEELLHSTTEIDDTNQCGFRTKW